MQVKKYTVAHHFCKRSFNSFPGYWFKLKHWVSCLLQLWLCAYKTGTPLCRIELWDWLGGGRIFTRGAYYLHKPPGISHKRSENVVQNTVLDKTLTLKWPISNEIYWPTFWSAVKSVANIFWFASTIVWAFSIFTIRVAVAFVKVHFAFVDIWKKISSKILN